MKTKNYRLKKERDKRSLSQEYMAKKLGISITTFRLKENGSSEFTESEIFKIANELDLSPMDIFFSY